MRRPVVFLSSTFLDLKFERRFVARILAERGLHVITMEHDCKPGFDWQRWSLNRAGQCDILVQLFADRIGTNGNPLSNRGFFSSISSDEEFESRPTRVLRIAYQLQRPFPDAELLYDSDDEEREYRKNLALQDQFVADSHIFASQLERATRSGVPVVGVAELARMLRRDVRLSRYSLMKNRLSVWRRHYFDTNSAGWRRAFEDESCEEQTSRTALAKHLRVPVLILGMSISIVAFGLLPFRAGCAVFVCFILMAGIAILAWAPTYVWAGTKTLVARGTFGLLTLQQSRTDRFTIEPRWGRLDDWCGIGAVSLAFANGRSVFVPFIHDSGAFSRKASRQPHMPAPPTIDTEPALDPDCVLDKIRKFAEELKQHRK